MDLFTINNGRIHSLASIVQYDDTATFATHILYGFMQHALQYGAQIERRSYFTADMIQKFK